MEWVRGRQANRPVGGEAGKEGRRTGLRGRWSLGIENECECVATGLLALKGRPRAKNWPDAVETAAPIEEGLPSPSFNPATIFSLFSLVAVNTC